MPALNAGASSSSDDDDASDDAAVPLSLRRRTRGSLATSAGLLAVGTLVGGCLGLVARHLQRPSSAEGPAETSASPSALADAESLGGLGSNSRGVPTSEARLLPSAPAFAEEPDGYDQELGLFRFGAVDGSTAFLDSDKRDERAVRLQNGATLQLYHQTSPSACRSILAHGFHAGSAGITGGGIYFAESTEATKWKAHHKGCMIRAWVRVGNPRRMHQYKKGDNALTGDKLLEAGYDSVYLNGALPLKIGKGASWVVDVHDPEWVIFFKDQVVNMTAYPCNKDGSRLRGRR